MEVNHTTDHVTQVTIGGSAHIQMGISDSAEFFQILSSTLYSDQLLAVVRETTCNAWDAHVDSDRTDKAIEVIVSNSTVVIRDFGKGIHHDLIGPIYGVYGNSTKKNDGMQTGGFGLGCKAPFAYTDHFQVTSSHEGVRTIYNMSKSSAQAGGKPSIIPIASFPTTETGLEVSINIKPEDQRRFLELFRQIIRNGEMKATLNGNEVEVTPYSQAQHGFMIMVYNPMYSENRYETSISVRYGNVIYPLKKHEDIPQMDMLLCMISKLPGIGYQNNIASIVLLAPPHSISVTPSRESLSMQEHTVNTVNELISNTIAHLSQVNQALPVQLLKEAISKADAPELLNLAFNISYHTFNKNDWAKNKLLIQDNNVFRRAALSVIYDEDMRKKDFLLRIAQGDKKKLYLPGKAYSLYREVQRSKGSIGFTRTRWVGKHIVAPVLKKLCANPQLLASRLFFLTAVGSKPATEAYRCDLANAPLHARPNVIIYYIRKEVELRVQKEATLTGRDRYQTLFYHVPRVVDKVKAAVEFFESIGYNVIDLTKPLAGETPASVAPALRSIPTPRQAGYISMATGITNREFSANKLYARDALRIMDPKCAFLCSDSDAQRGANKLADFSKEISDTVVRLYGNVSALAKTNDQLARYKEKGIAHGLEYVILDVISYINNSAVLTSYLRSMSWMINRGYEESIYTALFKSKDACAVFNLPHLSDPKDIQYYSLWKYLIREHRRNLTGALAIAEAAIYAKKPDANIMDLCNKIKASPYLPFVNTRFYFNPVSPSKPLIDFINLLIK